MKNLTKLRKALNKEDITYCTVGEFKKIFGKESFNAVNNVYIDLKERIENPVGYFDKAGRFFLDSNISDLSTSRTPSRAYPYSEMNEARTRKFIIKVFISKNCKTEEDLKKYCFASNRIKI